jgi:GNAT superfamily N-acetyltransferase
MPETLNLQYLNNFNIQPSTVGERYRSRLIQSGQPVPTVVLYEESDFSSIAYQSTLGQAFNFMRRNSAGRYSSSALMRVQRAHDDLQDGMVSRLPCLLVAERAAGYDELTEIKSGGILGMAVAWPDRTLLAVQPAARRQGLGSVLVAAVTGFIPEASRFWVARTNREGQQFLLRQGLVPQSMNNRGAIAFAIEGGEASETESEAIYESVPF